ncbi:FAD-dependent monooxygenase [Nonomuraea sp. NPDC050786]|uniref:FAD-dependent monooxygenase n=1 Tax=Nonomuraea sp. NPDC050786 TaxID=3154840 RepID=UPI0033C80F7C
MTTPDENAPVLIVGGGYAGLASALFLSGQGVRPVLVDKQSGVSIQGRARGINQRTMELYRPLGLAARIAAAGAPFDAESGVVRCESLAGEWTWLLDDDSPRAFPELTAGEYVMADQRSVEPILIEAARGLGADIRFDTQCLSVDVDDDGVTAVTEDRISGERRTIRSDYLIAADGFRGAIRRRLGIDHTGPGVTQNWVTFIVEADLAELVTQRAMLWIVVNAEIGFGSFLTTAVPGQWAISFTYDPAKESPADFTPARCEKVARTVIGRDVPVTVLDIACWEEAVGVADRYRHGRVFLAGDSAHVWSPAGAMGANAAVQDAHNLAWKLAGVLGGWAGAGLLDTYEPERRPVARTLAEITVRRQQARFSDQPYEDDVDDLVCALGQRYGHESVYGDRVVARAVPGARAPHLWLRHEGRRITVHDLFHDAFVLLTGADGAGWTEAADKCAAQLGVPLRAYRVGREVIDVDGAWEERYGAGRDGAVLVRPDGYVAWCGPAPDADPEATLRGVLGRTLARTS